MILLLFINIIVLPHLFNKQVATEAKEHFHIVPSFALIMTHPGMEALFTVTCHFSTHLQCHLH